MLGSVAWQDKGKRPLTSRETLQEKRARVEHAEKRKVRKLSAWNAFQRSELQGKSLTGLEWKAFVKEVGKKWARMSKDERRPYVLEAEVQQSRLDRLAEMPLQSQSEAKSNDAALQGSPEARDDSANPSTSSVAGDDVWRNAAKKLSCRRLVLNKQALGNHSIWNLPTQCGDSALVLGRDLHGLLVSGFSWRFQSRRDVMD